MFADKEVELVSSSSAAEAPAPAQPEEGRAETSAPAQGVPAVPASTDDEPPPPEPFGEVLLLVCCDSCSRLRCMPAALAYTYASMDNLFVPQSFQKTVSAAFQGFGCLSSAFVCCRVHTWRSLVHGP